MEFLNIFLDVVKNKYADFNGRARRKEYWGYILILVIISVILNVVFGVILGSIASFFAYIPYLVSLALLVPGIAIGVRRLHDIGKSGYLMFLCLVPLVGSLYLIYLFVQEGVAGSNEYGEDPKSDVKTI